MIDLAEKTGRLLPPDAAARRFAEEARSIVEMGAGRPTVRFSGGAA